MPLSNRIVCIYSIRILHAPPRFSLHSVLASPRCRIHLRRGVHEPVRPPRPGPGPSFGAISPVPEPPLCDTPRVSRSSAQKTTTSKRRCVAARSIACSSARAAVPPDSHSRYSRTTTQPCAARIIRTPPAERRPNQEPHTALGGRLRESPVWLVRRKPAGRTAGLHPWPHDRRQMDSAALPVHRNRGRASHCLRTHKTWTLRLPPAMTPSSGAATRLDLAQSPHRVLLFCRHCGFGYRLPAHKLRGAGGCRVHKLRIEVIPDRAAEAPIQRITRQRSITPRQAVSIAPIGQGLGRNPCETREFSRGDPACQRVGAHVLQLLSGLSSPLGRLNAPACAPRIRCGPSACTMLRCWSATRVPSNMPGL